MGGCWAKQGAGPGMGAGVAQPGENNYNINKYQ